MEQWKIGDIVVTKVPEIAGGWFPIDLWLAVMPDCTLEAVEQLEWLSPEYRRGNEINLSIHTLLVETRPTKSSSIPVPVTVSSASGSFSTNWRLISCRASTMSVPPATRWTW